MTGGKREVEAREEVRAREVVLGVRDLALGVSDAALEVSDADF